MSREAGNCTRFEIMQYFSTISRLNQTVQWLVLISSWSKAMKNKAGLSLCTKQYQWWQPPQTQGSFDYGLSQWETTLQCKVVSHWMNPYHELWSVTRDQAPLFVYLCFSLFYITWPAEGGRSRNFQWLSRKNQTVNTLMSCCMPGSLTSGFLWSRWRGKRSRHSWPMRSPQFCVSGKRPIARLSPWCHVVFIMATDLKICKFAVTQHHWCIDTISTGTQSTQWQKIPRDLLNDVKPLYLMPLLSYTSLQEYVLKRACFHLGLGIGTGRDKSAT